MSGYSIGPTLAPDVHPFDRPGFVNWEQDPSVDDGHRHSWESVLLQADGRRRWRMEEVIRCSTCHAPRCGYSTDPDPCVQRRHHREPHIYLSGAVEPVGGAR